jgi:hypothetical protein
LGFFLFLCADMLSDLTLPSYFQVIYLFYSG